MLRPAALFTKGVLAFYNLVTSERRLEVRHSKWAALSLLCTPITHPGGETAEVRGPLFGGGVWQGSGWLNENSQ